MQQRFLALEGRRPSATLSVLRRLHHESPETMSDEPAPSKFRVWKLAARPHTLTASVAPVVVGYALTLRTIRRHADELALRRRQAGLCDGEGGGRDVCAAEDLAHLTSPRAALAPAIQFAAFAALVQIATNLHNDYADFVKGADTHERVGHARATQRGWLTPYETCRGCVLCLLGALLVGMQFLIPIDERCSAAEGGADRTDPVMVLVVLSSLFNAVAYTGGPFPLGYIGLGGVSIGYSGLGDLFVFLYFGLVATMGAPYLYLTKMACFSPSSGTMASGELIRLLQPSFLHSLPVGFLATAIIVVNNLRDRHTDVRAGKMTTAVRFGGKFAKMEYLALVVGSYAFCVYFWLTERAEHLGKDLASIAWTALLPLLSAPMAIPQLNAVAFGGKEGQSLNEHVGGTAKLQMIYCFLVAAGLAVVP
ncbi:hypothetical protein ACHAWF_015788 [Thalassiosira exigua]